MGQTLTHGIYLPDEGERNCYNGLAGNWQMLDGAVGTVAEHTTQIAGKAPAVHTHTKSQITDFPVYGNSAGTICEGNDSRLSDARTPVAHTHTKADVTDLLNSNFIPSANNSYDLGSSSYQWNNAYIKSLTINGVACGDILTHNVNEFVDVMSAQTITGVKTFASNIIIQSGKKVTCNLDNSFIELDGGTTWGKGGSIVLSGQDRSSYTNSVLIVSKSDTNTDILQYQNGELKPLSNNTNNSSLGTSTHKWKTLNGVNPGALSLPNLDSTQYDPIDFSQWNVSLGFGNNYVPQSDGWIHVNIKDSTNCSVFVFASNSNPTYAASAYGNGSQGLTGRVALMMPVRAGVTYTFMVKASSTSDIYSVKFFPCLGNV